MATPVVVVPSGGLPITVVSAGGLPMEIASNGRGIAVTVIASGGLPVTGVSTGPDVTAPIITSSNTYSQPENSSLIIFLMANEAVTWAKVGGADSAKFTLGSGATAGQLSLPAKDYELPDDSNTDRIYQVQVQATDAASNVSAVQTITVTITDVADTLTAGPTLNLKAVSDSGSSSTDNYTNNNTLQFDVDFTGTGAIAGWILEFNDGASLLTTHTLTAGEITGDPISLGLAPLADATYAFKARLDKGSGTPRYSAYGATETVTVDTVAPTLTSPTGAPTGATTASGAVTTNEATGTLVFNLMNGVTVAFTDSVPVTSSGTKLFTATGLTAGTSYTPTFVHTDKAGNVSSTATGTAFTTSGGGSYDADASAFFASAQAANGGTDAITSGEKTAINAFIVAEKGAATGDLWAKCQNMMFMGLNAPVPSKHGWKKLAQGTVTAGTVTHTPHVGMHGDAVTPTFFLIGVNPESETSGQWQLNSAMFTIAVENARTATGLDTIFCDDWFSSVGLVPYFGAGATGYNINDYSTSFPGSPGSSSRGIYSVSRTSSTARELLYNGATADTSSAATDQIPRNLGVFSRSGDDRPSGDTLSVVWVGAGMTTAQAVEHQGHVRDLISAIIGGTAHY